MIIMIIMIGKGNTSIISPTKILLLLSPRCTFDLLLCKHIFHTTFPSFSSRTSDALPYHSLPLPSWLFYVSLIYFLFLYFFFFFSLEPGGEGNAGSDDGAISTVATMVFRKQSDAGVQDNGSVSAGWKRWFNKENTLDVHLLPLIYICSREIEWEELINGGI